MATFVLVPGAWLGSWAWKKVIPHLQANHHTIYAVTLTGLGERVHLAHPEVNLETHIQDVVNVFEYQALDSVILVGHSYSGMVVTGVIDQIPDRVSHLVYLDAIVPRPGQSLFDDWSETGQQAVAEEARLA
ncbi:MAG: alpha/beta fold hydrolase, partial [Chloroflexota bacterium]